MSNVTRRIEVRDREGRHGKLVFTRFISQNDYENILDYYKSVKEPAPAWTALLPDLCRSSVNDILGWWRPSEFKATSREVRVPQDLRLDPASLGWDAIRALRGYQAEIIDWIDNGPVETDMRWFREHRKEYAEKGTKVSLPSPFENTSVVEKIEALGVELHEESVDQLLEVGCFVIYSGQYNAYLTPQHDWKALARALIFTTEEDAKKIITDRRLSAQVAQCNLRVDQFTFPDKLAPQARHALANREAEELGRATSGDQPSARRSPRL